jgi:cytochrome b pre-mRNA-processing protein 3
MLAWLKRNSDRAAIEHELFERIVAQSRSPHFYRDLGVPDSMEGRFEMILLHFALLLGRLKTEGAAGQRLGQALMEKLFASMDDALRQIGIGDMGVPRRVKKAAAAFIERTRDYEAALAGPAPSSPGQVAQADPLAAAIARHAFSAPCAEANAAAGAAAIAHYMRQAREVLVAQPADEIFLGRLTFPEPDAAART